MSVATIARGFGPAVGAAVLGGIGARKAPTTYARLRKPRWAPPAEVFGPVWTTLYAMIGTAGVRMSTRASRTTLALHGTQLALNAAWPIAFFDRGSKRSALAIIVALDAALTAEIVRLRTEDPVSAGLLAPYLAWTGFATALNAAVSEPSRAG